MNPDEGRLFLDYANLLLHITLKPILYKIYLFSCFYFIRTGFPEVVEVTVSSAYTKVDLQIVLTDF